MRFTTRFRKCLCVLLAAVLLAATGLTSRAAGEFSYYFSDSSRTAVAVAGFSGSADANGVVTVPDEIDGYPVVRIVDNAFAGRSDLKELRVNKGVVVEPGAFNGCANAVTVVYEGYEAEEPEAPVDPGKKSDYEMRGKVLVRYTGSAPTASVPTDCTEIAANAFRDNQTLTSVYLPPALKTIGAGAFASCVALTTVEADERSMSLNVGRDAFAGTPWLANYPSPLVLLGDTLIKYKGNEKYVTLPVSVTNVADGAFDGSGAKYVRLPANAAGLVRGSFPSGMTVYAPADSAAMKACAAAGIPCVQAFPYGDADMNGRVTAGDARQVLRISARLEKKPADVRFLPLCDLDRDGNLTARDARMILRISARLETYDGPAAKEPIDAYEVLTLVQKIFASAKSYAPFYTKYAYQEWQDVQIRSDLALYYDRFEDELTPKRRAQTVSFTPGSDSSIANLPVVTMLDPSKLTAFSCDVNPEGEYVIRLTLADEKIASEKAAGYNAFTARMFPVEPISHFTEQIEHTLWYRSGLTNVRFDMTYTGCTMELRADADSLNITNVTMNMYYRFEIYGKVNGITAKTKIFGGEEPAQATRHDVIQLSGFAFRDQS